MIYLVLNYTLSCADSQDFLAQGSLTRTLHGVSWLSSVLGRSVSYTNWLCFLKIPDQSFSCTVLYAISLSFVHSRTWEGFQMTWVINSHYQVIVAPSARDKSRYSRRVGLFWSRKRPAGMGCRSSVVQHHRSWKGSTESQASSGNSETDIRMLCSDRKNTSLNVFYTFSTWGNF